MKKAFSIIEISIVILVIGILIAATTQTSKMISKARLANARLTTTSSGIDKIPNMIFWVETTLEGSLKTAARTTQPENNDTISTWKDLNPTIQKYNLSQTTAASRPTYITDAINGIPALKFDGTNDIFSTTNLIGRDFSIFMVIRTANAGAGTSTSTAWQSSAVIWSDIGGFLPNDAIPFAIGGGRIKIAASADTVLIGNTSISDDKPHVITLTRAMKSGALSIYLDSTSDATPINGSTVALTANSQMSIAGGIGITHFNGYIAELIIYERVLKQNERRAVEAYLGKKWGIRVN